MAQLVITIDIPADPKLDDPDEVADEIIFGDQYVAYGTAAFDIVEARWAE